jgi:acyl carrier protein
MENVTMGKEAIYEAVRATLVEELGIETDDVSMKASFYDDLGMESLDLLKLFFGLEKRIDVRITIKEVQALLTGNLSEEEFFNDNGLVSAAGLKHLEGLLPDLNLAETPEGIDQLKLFSMFTVGHLVNIIAEKISSKADIPADELPLRNTQNA